METKQITLRSQTVQCPHCGEYYSVTYKYCPFCDVGRQEEERRMAERKKQRQQKLGGLFGAEPDKKKKRPSGSAPRKEAPARRESPVHDFEDEAPAQSAPKKKESLFFSKPTRKKTSEMTEEEKKAFKAEREARAAERKRERDRLAREAAIAAGEPDPIFDAADAYEAPTQETFEMAEVPVEAPETAAPQEAPAAEPAPVEEVPVQTPAEAAPAAEPGPWDDLRQLEMTPDAPVVVEVANEPVLAETVQPQPAVAVQAEPAAASSDEDLDALLSEIRDMLADSPVPTVAPDQLKKPVQPVVIPEAPAEGGAHLAPEMPAVEIAPQAPAAPEVEIQVEAEPEVQAAPAAESAPVEEPAPAEEAPAESEAPAAEEPTIVIPTEEVAAAVAEASIVDEAPTQVLPVEEIQTLEEKPETPVTAAPIPEKKEEPAPKKKAPKKKKKSILPVVLSLILIVAAGFIVAKTLVPAFSDGLFSSQSADAETITLDKEELTFAEAGATATLAPIFAPEGTTAPITWASSDEAVATVDENGTVTAVAKGLATITATLENGQSAQCVVNCSWEDAPAQPAEEETPPAGPGLSTSTLTLDGEGKTSQLQVTGVEGAVKWSSNKTDVATVAEDGTVTAVGKGSAVITAEVGEQTFTCEVKCIW